MSFGIRPRALCALVVLVVAPSSCLLLDGVGGLTSAPDAHAIDSSLNDSRNTEAAADGSLSGDAADSSAGGPTGLIAYYAFDDGSGTIAEDSSGNGNNGTLTGSALFGPGLRNGGLVLDGSQGYVSLPMGLVAGLTSFSVSAWINLSAGTLGAHLFDFGTNPTDCMYVSPDSTVNSLRFGIAASGQPGSQTMDSLPISAGQWEHVAVTMAQGTVTLYVNGALVAQTQSFTETPASLGITTQNWIGRSQSATDPCLSATVDEFRVYSRALSANEVLLEARMLPYVWYPFDDGTGSIAHDATGGGHDATLLGAATWGSGRSGGAVVLDGQTGYVQLPASILATANEATVGGWVYLSSLTPNARLFDFGSGTSQYMYVSPENGFNLLEFSITTGGLNDAQFARGSVPVTGAWQLIMVTLSGGMAQLDVNGSPAGDATAVSLTPSNLVPTPNDWIGRSQYSSDPRL
jgi:hypothetical protein